MDKTKTTINKLREENKELRMTIKEIIKLIVAIHENFIQ